MLKSNVVVSNLGYRSLKRGAELLRKALGRLKNCTGVWVDISDL
jgi:hypothetical protein